MEITSVFCKAADDVSHKFPAGLRVLVVDDDTTYLLILEKMLRSCLYQVTKCNCAEAALALLGEKGDDYDIVISDVHMPDMDGFKILEQVGRLMDLPVIMMSVDDNESLVMKCVTAGACDYLIKPVSLQALKNIWQHVVRKKGERKNNKDIEHCGSVEDADQQHKPSEDAEYSSSADEGVWKSSKKRKDKEDDDGDERDDISTLKKPRIVWTVELHQQFVAAVAELGIDKVVPKKILALMNVPGLTRENVASHLQKYRLYLRRLSGKQQHGFSSLMGYSDTAFGSMSSVNRIDLQASYARGELPGQSLASQTASVGRPMNKSVVSLDVHDQRNLFSFETSPKTGFDEGQQQMSNNNKRVSLPLGIPMIMEPNKLANLPYAQPFTSKNVGSQVTQTGSVLMQMNQPQGTGQLLSETNGSQVPRMMSSMGQNLSSNAIPGGFLNPKGLDRSGPLNPFSQSSSVIDFGMNQNYGFPLLSNPAMPTLASKSILRQEANLDNKGSGGFVPGYNLFNELHHQNPTDLGQSIRSTFDISQHPTFQGTIDRSHSGLAQECFSSSHKDRQHPTPLINRGVFSVGEEGQNITSAIGQLNPFLADSSRRIKEERLSGSSCQNDIFSQQYEQGDLLYAFLRQPHDSANSIADNIGFDTV